MWTIVYIHNIKNKIAYITYSHVDQDTPYLLNKDKGMFHAWDIIAIGLQEHIYNNGIVHYDIIDIAHIQDFDTCLITYFYEYQSCLMNIAFDNFVTNSFINKLKHMDISTILIDKYLNSIVNNSGVIDIANYVDSISIAKLVQDRIIVVEEYEYDKNGDYSYRCRINCTTYKDSYLNSLLYFVGSYSPTCCNNFPKQLPHETYNQAVKRLEEETKQQALKRYCKYEHLLFLLKECISIKSLYQQEIENTFNTACKYINYNKPCLQKDIQKLGR